MTHHPHYAENWDHARTQAIHTGLRIIEHGWEQHVIIDEAAGIVYRYPRHQAAAEKLEDEVAVLNAVHKQVWSVQLPVIREHTPVYTSYDYIPGEVLNKDRCDSFTKEDFVRIGSQLGTFLSQFHKLKPGIIDAKKTKQSTSLHEYYTNRIMSAYKKPMFESAANALASLTSSKTPQVVVHGDLHGLNMVIDPSSRSLTGVIDLSEMEVGDPHQDFRKLFMSDERLLEPAIQAYDQPLSAERVRTWAYVNEWANICHFIETPDNPTYRRAIHHLQKWGQL